LISLKEARFKHQEAQKLLLNGIDPSADKKEIKLKSLNSFDSIAR